MSTGANELAVTTLSVAAHDAAPWAGGVVGARATGITYEKKSHGDDGRHREGTVTTVRGVWGC